MWAELDRCEPYPALRAEMLVRSHRQQVEDEIIVYADAFLVICVATAPLFYVLLIAAYVAAAAGVIA